MNEIRKTKLILNRGELWCPPPCGSMRSHKNTKILYRCFWIFGSTTKNRLIFGHFPKKLSPCPDHAVSSSMGLNSSVLKIKSKNNITAISTDKNFFRLVRDSLFRIFIYYCCYRVSSRVKYAGKFVKERTRWWSTSVNIQGRNRLPVLLMNVTKPFGHRVSVPGISELTLELKSMPVQLPTVNLPLRLPTTSKSTHLLCIKVSLFLDYLLFLRCTIENVDIEWSMCL